MSLQVIGGNLDHTDSQVLRENGGKELVISLLNQSGRVRSKPITSAKIFLNHVACWVILHDFFCLKIFLKKFFKNTIRV